MLCDRGHIWKHNGRRLQREQEPKSPFVFTSERGAPFSTAGFWRARSLLSGGRLGMTVRKTVAGETSLRGGLTMTYGVPRQLTVRIMLDLWTAVKRVIPRYLHGRLLVIQSGHGTKTPVIV